MQPQILMITCDRKPVYIHDSLRSMFSQDSNVSQAHIVVCGSVEPNAKFLTEYEERQDCKFYVHRPNTYERDMCSRSNNYTRIVRNTIRAIDLSDDDKPVIFCEDDCKFSKNWLQRTLKIVGILPSVTTEYQRTAGNEFVLALYSPYEHKPERLGYAEYHPNDFFGNVCLYMTPGAKKTIVAYMKAEIDKPGHAPCDILVKKACWDNQIPIFAIAPSVVDHTGDSSSKGNTEVIRAPSFNPEEPLM